MATEDSIYKDIMAVYKYLTINLDFNPKSIVLYGKSLGSGPSCYLADKQVVGGLILHAGFTSILRVVFDVRFTFPFDIFPNIDRMPRIRCPTFILHGQMDEVVSVKHGLELYEKAANKVKPYFVPDGGHNNLEEYATEYYQRVNEFLALVQHNMAEHTY